MSAAEIITAVIALAAALGTAALKWLDHSLTRRDREARLNERSIKVAQAMMTRLEVELAKTRAENEALRAKLGNRPDGTGPESDRR